MTAVQRTDLESLATALLERVDGLVESNAKLQSEVHDTILVHFAWILVFFFVDARS